MQNKKEFTVKKLVFSAVAIALATALSFVKFADLPYGGSITLFSMFFVAIVGYWYGAKIGIAAGIAYGLLQLLFGAYVVHPVQLLLDYPLAFGALGLSGLFTNKKNGLVAGYAVGVAGRFVMHSISGFIFFTEYTGVMSENLAAIWASFLYNLSYILPEMLVTIVLLLIPAVKNAMNQVKKMAVE